MNLFDNLLFNFIFIICPLILYLFYIAYNKNISKKTNSLSFNIIILTSFYLIIKFNDKSDAIFLILFIVPLIIAYIKIDMLSITLLSIIQISIVYGLYNCNIYILISEYIIFYILSKMLPKRYLALIYILFENLFIILFMNNYFKINIFKLVVISILIYLMYKFIAILMDMGEKILEYHMSVKELEKEKQIRNSLFKIAHEIKNPMAVCKGYFDMMNFDNEKQVKKYLPIIKQEIDHTLIILQDFLSITKVNVEKDIMDINMLVEEVANSFKPIFKNKNIKINVELIDDEIYINGDYNRLKQVLINIIKNSIESIDEKNKNDGNININAKIENNYYDITIEDNGIGMSKETLNHFLEPFFTTKQNGTGLGTTLSKEILKSHNANIEYSSTEDIGTCVLIKFPIEKNAL